MNEITRLNMDFKFLSGTDLGTSTEEIGQYVGHVYEKALYERESYEGEMADFLLPSRFMLLTEAWDTFDELYMQYVLNGHGGRSEDYIREEIEDGINPYDMIEMWRDDKGFNASFSMFYTHDQIEKVHLTDVANSLLLFNMSYIRDNCNDDVFFRHDLLKAEEWVNPALVRVW